MNSVKISTKRNILVVLVLITLTSITTKAEHNHQTMLKEAYDKASTAKTSQATCKSSEITCAKTVTSAFAPNGDLWRVWAIGEAMYFQISQDNGNTFMAAKQVKIPAEKISARNENRPKIAFDKHQGVYLSWAMPREKKYTADVRFSYSSDYGKSFSIPVTVNNDNLLAGHSFNEILVTENGEINIVWLDGRLSHQLRTQGKKVNGSALFYAKANFRAGITEFTNQQLANETCVCCRIAMDFNQQGELAILWRHIYGDNIREFALLTLANNRDFQANIIQAPVQISHDHWKINGCPHQGGGISIDQSNRYHMVWFNQGDKGKGIFYATTNDQGKTLNTALSVGDLNAQAAHPHVMENNKVIDIVWTQFTGIEHQLWHQQSVDSGISFGEAKKIAQASFGSDRPFIFKNAGQSFVSWHRPKQGHWIQKL